MIKVGKRDVLLNTIIFIPINETSEIELNLGESDLLHVVIAFENGKSSEKDLKPSFSVEGDGNKGIITFKNWNETFGSSISEPLIFASDDEGNGVSFMGNVVKHGEMYKAELQFMRESNSNVK